MSIKVAWPKTCAPLMECMASGSGSKRSTWHAFPLQGSPIRKDDAIYIYIYIYRRDPKQTRWKYTYFKYLLLRALYPQGTRLPYLRIWTKRYNPTATWGLHSDRGTPSRWKIQQKATRPTNMPLPPDKHAFADNYAFAARQTCLCHPTNMHLPPDKYAFNARETCIYRPTNMPLPPDKHAFAARQICICRPTNMPLPLASRRALEQGLHRRGARWEHR